MKKWYFCLICLFCTASITQGQYYRQDNGFLLGVDAGYSYPLGDMGKILKNGLGGNVVGKYLINHVIGIGFEAGYHSFKSKVLLSNDNTDQDYKCRLIPVLLDASFYMPNWDHTILPYLGIHFGAYLTNIKVSRRSDIYGIPTLSKKLFIVSPGVGLNAGSLFELSEQVYLDFKIRVDYVPKVEDSYQFDENTPGNIGFDKILNIGANIGLLYKF
mgnify:FL=1